MSKINLTYNDKEYTLEFTRQTVRTMESQGFVFDELTTKPATMFPMLFAGAFYRHHKGMKRALQDEIYDELPRKTDFIQVLGEMYAETLSSLMDDKEDEGNVSWAVVQ